MMHNGKADRRRELKTFGKLHTVVHFQTQTTNQDSFFLVALPSYLRSKDALDFGGQGHNDTTESTSDLENLSNKGDQI